MSTAQNVHLMQAARGVAKDIPSLAIEMLIVQRALIPRIY
jgi:hypothetical protein